MDDRQQATPEPEGAGEPQLKPCPFVTRAMATLRREWYLHKSEGRTP